MGKLLYGSNYSFDFDDRTLTHLRTVITSKLLRQESFSFTWKDDGCQRTLWMHPGIVLVFQFDSESTDAINPEWIAVLTQQANTPAGLRLVPEPRHATLVDQPMPTNS